MGQIAILGLIILLCITMHADKSRVDAGLPTTQSQSNSQIRTESKSNTQSESPTYDYNADSGNSGDSGTSDDSGQSDQSDGSDESPSESPSYSESESDSKSHSNSETSSFMKSNSPIFIVKAEASNDVGIYVATGVVFGVVFVLSTVVCVKLMFKNGRSNQPRVRAR